MAHTRELYHVDFVVNGMLTISSEVDCGRAAIAGDVQSVIIARGKAGNSGQTVVDVKIEGVSVFPNPADRPKILASQGNNVCSQVANVENVGCDALDYVTIDIVEAEQGPASNLHVRVTFNPV